MWVSFLDRFGDGSGRRVLAVEWFHGLGDNEAAPADVLVRLVGRTSEMFYRKLPDEVLDAAIACPDRMVRVYLAGAQKFMDADRWVRLIATEPPGAGSHFGLIPSARRNCRLVTRDDLLRRGADPDPQVRLRTLWLPRLPAGLVAALAADPDPTVRAAACDYAWRRLEPERCSALLADPDPVVRRAAAVQAGRDRPMSAAEFDALADIDRALAIRRQVFERELAERLVASDNVMVRLDLARVGRLDPDLIAVLAEDERHLVRAGAVVRPDVDEEFRQRILADLSPRVTWDRVEWVEELHEDEDAMRDLARSVSVAIRRSVARARNLPLDVADLLAGDPDRDVRSLLAKYCEQAPDTLVSPLYEEFDVREAAVANPGFPTQALVRALSRPNLARAAARNPAIPPAVMHAMISLAESWVSPQTT